MKHIAASGVKAGQWVTCPARIKCQLEGTIHASDNELYKVRLWKQEETNEGKYLALKNLTREDYENFNALPQDEKNIYEEMFKDKMKESQKRAERKAHNSRPVTERELKAIANLHKMAEERRKPQTIKMDDGVAVQRVKYSDEEKAQARENFNKTQQVLEKWQNDSLEEQDIVEYVSHLQNVKTWGNDRQLEKKASETIVEGLLYPFKGESLVGSLNTLATSTLIFQITSYDKDVIKGVKKGSHFAEYARREKAVKKEREEKREAEAKAIEEARLAKLKAEQEAKQAKKKKSFFRRFFS